MQRHGLIDIFKQEGLFCAKKAMADQTVLFLSFSNGKKFEQERAVRLPDATVFFKVLHLLACGALIHPIRKVRRCLRPFLRLLTFDEGEKLTQSFMCERGFVASLPQLYASCIYSPNVVEMDLQERITQLQGYRRAGITSLSGFLPLCSLCC